MSDAAVARGELGNVTVTISGDLYEVTGWTGLQIIRGIDQAADAFSFSFPWQPTEENKQRFVAYRTSQVQIKYDSEVIVTGIAEKYEPVSSAEGINMTINGRSRSGALLDISAGPPFELVGAFNAIASQIIPDGFPVTATAQPDVVPSGGVVVEIEPGQSVYDVLSSIAAGRNLYAHPQRDGSLIFKQISIPEPVAEIYEGTSPVVSVATTTDLTKRYYEYVVTNIEGSTVNSASAIDGGVSQSERARLLTETNQDVDLQEAANFARSRGIMDSFTCRMTVSGWTVNGVLWAPGMTVYIEYPSAMIYPHPGFPKIHNTLMVKRVTMQLDESGGAITELDLTFPQVFAGGAPAFPYPWSLT